MQVFSGLCDSVQQPHSEGDICNLNLSTTRTSYIHQNSGQLGWVIYLKSGRIRYAIVYSVTLYIRYLIFPHSTHNHNPVAPMNQPTSANAQSILLVLLNWQLSHCGSSHTAPVSYLPPHLRIPLSCWISGSSNPHRHWTEATWPISL